MPDAVDATAQATADSGAAGTAADAAVAASAAATAATGAVTYDLKLPADSTLDPAIVERATANAREWGLSSEAGQKLLDSYAAEATTVAKTAAEKAVEAQRLADAEANKPGGTEWVKRVDAWKAEVEADPDVGGTKLAVATEQAQQAITRISQVAKVPVADVRKFLDDTGLGSNKIVFKIFAGIGKMMAEPSSLVGGAPPQTGQKTAAETLYGPDGRGPKPTTGS